MNLRHILGESRPAANGPPVSSIGPRRKRPSGTLSRWAARIVVCGILALVASAVAGAGTANAGLFCPIGEGTITLNNPYLSGGPWSCTRWQDGFISFTEVEYHVTSGSNNGCAGSRGRSDDFQHINSSNADIQAYVCGTTSAACTGGCGTSINSKWYPWIKDSGGGSDGSSRYWGFYS